MSNVKYKMQILIKENLQWQVHGVSFRPLLQIELEFHRKCWDVFVEGVNPVKITRTKGGDQRQTEPK